MKREHMSGLESVNAEGVIRGMSQSNKRDVFANQAHIYHLLNCLK